MFEDVWSIFGNDTGFQPLHTFTLPYIEVEPITIPGTSSHPTYHHGIQLEKPRGFVHDSEGYENRHRIDDIHLHLAAQLQELFCRFTCILRRRGYRERDIRDILKTGCTVTRSCNSSICYEVLCISMWFILIYDSVECRMFDVVNSRSWIRMNL